VTFTQDVIVIYRTNVGQLQIPTVGSLSHRYRRWCERGSKGATVPMLVGGSKLVQIGR